MSTATARYVLYEFTLAAGTLKEERPIVAMAVRTEGHTGGGLVMLDDRTLLFTPGDNGDSYEDGRTEAQSPSNHLSKILRIDVATADVAPVAVGVRNCQRLVIYGTGAEARLVFVDPGGWVADELNSVLVRELVGAATPLNFGWGRAAVDGRSREGSFFIDQLGNSVGRIQADEAGFVKPVAEVGRESAPLFGLEGPVSSPSFQSITALVSDLVGGDVFATTRPLGEPTSRSIAWARRTRRERRRPSASCRATSVRTFGFSIFPTAAPASWSSAPADSTE